MSKYSYEEAVIEIDELLPNIEPAVVKLLTDPYGRWQNRKKYSRLSENITKGYVLSKIRDIRTRGRSEADKLIEKLIFGKKTELPSTILKFISENRNVWRDFICRMATTLDAEALVGFFIPFIYGGVISRKNMTGEAFGIVDLGENGGKTSQNERMLNAARVIDDFKRRGISIILIEGEAVKVYSRQMLSIYRSSPNEAFLIIEREEANDSLSSGDSAYNRAVLSELGASKNVFIVLDPLKTDHSVGSVPASSWMAGKSRALSSYGILHGAYCDIGEKIFKTVEKGSGLIVFDPKISLMDAFDNFNQTPKNASEAFDLIPKSIVDFLRAPALPMRLPDLYQFLILLQFLLTSGTMREIRRVTV